MKKSKRKRQKSRHFRDVFIEKNCLRSMMASAIEVYNRETNGVLLGRNSIRTVEGGKLKLIKISNIYPFQTERRTPSEVVHGNLAAFRRVMRTIESFKKEVLGGFHSHPYPYEVGLSEGDIESIRDEIKIMEKLGQERIRKGWLEILLSIRKKQYKRPAKFSWCMFDYTQKIRFRVRTKEQTVYDILISAYWVYFVNGRHHVKEVAVYVPWLLE